MEEEEAPKRGAGLATGEPHVIVAKARIVLVTRPDTASP